MMDKKGSRSGAFWSVLHISLYVLLGLMLAIGIYIAVSMDDMDYGHDAAYLSDRGYAKVFGVSDRFRADDFVAAYGGPERTERLYDADNDRTRALMYYPGFTLFCVVNYRYDDLEKTGPETLHLSAIQILDPALRFGRRSIGIGSTKEDVHRAYARDDVSHPDMFESFSDDFGVPLDEGYATDDWGNAFFHYDEQGRVLDMLLTRPVF